MYIENPNQKEKSRKSKELDEFLQRKSSEKKAGEEELLESPHDMLIAQNSKNVLYHWRGPEFEVYEKDNKWYLVMAAILLAIISWALYTNSPVMAITFILIGVVGYIYVEKEPRILDFIINDDGVMAGREIYEFDNLESFWIFYEPPHTKILSLKSRGILLPYVHIPLHDEDPLRVREILLDFIPERKQEEGLTEVLERLIRL